MEELIQKYKAKVRETKNVNEIYKWQLAKKYRYKPDVNAPDFGKEYKEMNYSNLIYHNARSVGHHFASEIPEKFREQFRILFNDSTDLQQRVSAFHRETLRLYREDLGVAGFSHHQDERTISAYLAAYDSNKYPFYKSSFYTRFCKLLGVNPKSRGEKYVHYKELLEDFILEYIIHDKELLDLKAGFLTDDCHEDTSNYILAQDILYQMLHQAEMETDKDEQKKPTVNIYKPATHSLNTILFGPPGTGKTYFTVNLALEILGEEIENLSRDKIKSSFDRYVAEGRIVFTTFHQSMSYEDFIEGIKPLEPLKEGDPISYKVVDGIFKMLCKSACTPTSTSFELAYSRLQDKLKDTKQGIIINVSENETITLYPHPNSTDLTVEATSNISTITKYGLQYVSDNQVYAGTWAKYYKAIFNLLTEKYGYEPNKKEDNEKYVLIIDEINRGNVAQIFGELITLIEEDKRTGKTEAKEIILPYSKQKFGVPPNLYIIGTMNTADRSVEALDTALRRRFRFREMMPLPGHLSNLNESDEEWAAYISDIETDPLSDYEEDRMLGEINMRKLLTVINLRIEKILDRDHMIGHSYFMKVKDLSALKTVFADEVIPLLQEYFFGDYGKIGLILGKGFIHRFDGFANRIPFADFEHDELSDYDERMIYRIRNPREMEDDSFVSAIKNLFNG